MGRERLMAQQRARVLAMRARKLAERKAAEATKKLAAKASTTKGPLKDGNKYAPTLKENRDSKKGPVADPKEYAKTLKKNKASKQGPVRDANEYVKNTLSQNKRRPSPKAQPSTSTTTGGTKPVQKQTNVQKAAEAVTQRSNPTNTRANRQPGSTGGRGGGGGSTPTKKKSKLNPQQQRKAGLTKKRGGTSLKDAIKKFNSKLRLTYKKGQLVQRGDEVYRSDGKGGLTRVYRKQF